MKKKSQPNKLDVDQLLLQYQQNECKEAQLQLVEHYKPLVESLARKYSKGKAFHEDLSQVGMIGLLGAMKRYDASFGRSFEAFAVPTIIGEIKRFLRDKTWSVHVPRRIKEIGPRIKVAVEELTTKFQRSPKVIEIAEFLEVSEEEVLEAMEMGQNYQTLSVDNAIEADSDGSTVTILDVVGSTEDGYEKVDHRLLLKKAFFVLSERERQIIECIFFENLSQKETGDRLGISQMHVSRLQRKALEKLKKAIGKEQLDSEILT
ncbi:RNA polymerase sigma factor SigB [Sutcliffiella sp. NC1]|uniref:RNA polymerase sigma factor SigB n=1 Tax=Sutcliffiella sp. NC1 TaxID=3004096 RepID=UPI0022DE92C8|nr:RNA polymerase sigma factor SigB [Sutcliffiella sp. NC1]WBL15349.1 RNA polymerase sigma factor SigB [Sutcliffiella sp. NC1]